MSFATFLFRSWRACAATLAACILVLSAGAQPATDAFDPSADGNVYAVAVLPDGRMLVGGSFTRLQPNRFGTVAVHLRLALLRADGSVDTAFQAGCDGDVTTIALQPDGRILIGGSFSTVWGTGDANTPGHPRNGLARLHVDGSIDAGFNPHPAISEAADNQAFPIPVVRAIAVQPDGRIVIGGAFTGFRAGGTFTPKERLARLNADGTLDATFTAVADNVVQSIALQADGRILVGGGFRNIRPTGADAFTNKPFLARLMPDGALDTGFTTTPNNRVMVMQVTVDGRILVGGEFTQLTVGSTTTTRTFLARLAPDGTVDAGFNPAPDAAVDTLSIQADGRILVGGRFTQVRPAGGTAFFRSYVMQLMPDGQLDTSFVANPNAPVRALAAQSDGSAVIGGTFNAVTGNTGTTFARGRLARVQADGALEALFTPQSGGRVSRVIPESDTSYLIAGSFSNYAGVTRTNIVRVSDTGVLDPDFNVEVNGVLTAAAVQPADGKILIGGTFTRVAGAVRGGIARLNPDGSLDTDFDPRANAWANDFIVQPDGKIIVAGAFTTLRPRGEGDTIGRFYLARLNADGTVDTSFQFDLNAAAQALEPLEDGVFLVGGDFNGVVPNGANAQVFRPYIARVSGNGVLDESFFPRPNARVRAIALQSDGSILVGGDFTELLPPDASEAIRRPYLARLTAAGQVDSEFYPNPNNSVLAIAPMSDGTIVAGGTFSALAPGGSPPGITRTSLVWLNPDGTLHETRTWEADGVVGALAPLADGRLLLGGEFAAIFQRNGAYTLTEDHVARLTADGAPDAAFMPSGGADATGAVHAIVRQDNGQLLVGGSFDNLSGSTNTNLTRLSVSGVPDFGFGSRVDGPVHAIYVRSPTEAPEAETGPVAWFQADGALRPSDEFSPTGAIPLVGVVETILRYPDGRLLLGGTFSNSAGTTGGNLVRLNADGTLDTSFNPAPDGTVTSLAFDEAGRILVGGDFDEIFDTARRNFARINTDDTLDALDLRTNASVRSITPIPGGSSFYLGGDFTQITAHGASSATTRPYFARINEAGTIDEAFAPTLNAAVFTVIIQDNNRILIGGNFTAVNSAAANRIARLNTTNGSTDTAFTLGFNGIVEQMVVDGQGRILAAGGFTTAFTSTTDSGVARQFVARFTIGSNGAATLDETFRPAISSNVRSIAVDSAGRIVIGGAFSSVTDGDGTNPAVRRFVARFVVDETTGAATLDDSFNPQPNDSIEAVVVPGDGPLADSVIIGGRFESVLPEALVLIGGEFTAVGNASIPYLARLSNDGSADPSFAPRPDGAVYALAGLADGRVLAAGDFENVGSDPAVPRGRLAVFANDGTLDETFTTATDGTVYAVDVQADGSILIGGTFTTVGGAAHANLARLDADGAVDASFSPSTDGAVHAIMTQPDGRVLIAGDFTTVNGTAQAYLARLAADGTLDTTFDPELDAPVSAIALQADGSVLIGGAFTTVSGESRSRFARLTSSGALDPRMNVAADGEVHAINVLPDGRPVLGGAFHVVDGRARHLVARLGAPSAATQFPEINAARTAITWTNGGSRPAFRNVRFSVSTDLSDWTDLGVAEPTGDPGVWQLTGIDPLPANELYYIRAQATVPSTRFASTGRLETRWQFYNNQVAGPRSVGGLTPEQLADANNGSGGSGSEGGGSGGGNGGGSNGGGSGGGSGSGGSGGGNGGGAVILDAYHLVNFSVRAQPKPGEKLITGFVIHSKSSQRVVLRAVGPGLEPLDVVGYMPAPRLELFGAKGQQMAAATAWSGDAVLAEAFKRVGAFALDPGSADAAQAPTLAPGIYTTHVSPSDGNNGIALAEVYFDGTFGDGSGLANVSARGPAGDGEGVLIIGFAVGGKEPRRFLVRAVGPGLKPLGVNDALTDPALAVYDRHGDIVAANEDWEVQVAGSAADIRKAETDSGAFDLAAGSTDAALVITLDPGIYTAHMTGTPTGGTGLVEVYELP